MKPALAGLTSAGKDKLTMVVELVTPAMAEQWLEKNYQHQRAIRWRDVERYAEAMRTGRWKLSPQGVAFTDTGKLADGQHRLWAIVQSETAVRLAVTRGMSEDAYVALDQGRVRSISDVSGLPWATPRLVGAARSMARGPGQGHWTLFDDREPELLLKFITKHETALRYICDMGTDSPRRAGFGVLKAPVLGCLARASYHVPKNRIERFVDILVTGEINAEAERGVLHFRDMLLGLGRAGASATRTATYQKCQRALKALLDEDPLRYIVALEADIFPLPGVGPQREVSGEAHRMGEMRARQRRTKNAAKTKVGTA